MSCHDSIMVCHLEVVTELSNPVDPEDFQNQEKRNQRSADQLRINSYGTLQQSNALVNVRL